MMQTPNINARDFATILNLNPYQTPFQLLEAKIEKKNIFFGNKFTEHGNKYESEALKIYEKCSGNKVTTNLSNCKHPNYEWITGRFDGITEINIQKKTRKRKRSELDCKKSCIVEIKCPLKNDRSEPLTIENIPKHYLSQCQVYMNMFDCDVSHYVEYYIDPNNNNSEKDGKMYILEIKRDIKWWDESLPKIEKFYEEMKKYSKLGSLDSHPVRIVEKLWDFQLSVTNIAAPTTENNL